MIFTYMVQSNQVMNFDINDLRLYNQCVFFVFHNREQCLWAETKVGARLASFNENAFFMLHHELINEELPKHMVLNNLYEEAYKNSKIPKDSVTYAIILNKSDLHSGEYQARFEFLGLLLEDDEEKRLKILKEKIREIVASNNKSGLLTTISSSDAEKFLKWGASIYGIYEKLKSSGVL